MLVGFQYIRAYMYHYPLPAWIPETVDKGEHYPSLCTSRVAICPENSGTKSLFWGFVFTYWQIGHMSRFRGNPMRIRMLRSFVRFYSHAKQGWLFLLPDVINTQVYRRTSDRDMVGLGVRVLFVQY